MPTLVKRRRADLEGWDRDHTFTLSDAVEKVRAFGKTKFDQSIEICIHLGIDPKQADQLVRGSIALPHGIGKTKRVIAFCGADKVKAAKEAGAIEAGGEELVKKIQDGWMAFDVTVASPDMMRVVSRLGKLLGPRGLMPSPKAGTVTANVAQAVKEYAAGKLEFRNDAGGNVHAAIGKQSFDSAKLVENAQTFIDTIERMRPSAAKGQYVKKITLSGTMTPGVSVAV
ncbi:MAG: 50S ribosomal protein L1 [Phycisphaeraceae bacterium]